MVRKEANPESQELKGVNLLDSSRLLSTVNALIDSAKRKEGGLQIQDTLKTIQVGEHSFLEASKAAVIQEFDFVRGVAIQYLPAVEEEFKEDEKRMATGCLVAGIDDRNKTISVGFTSYVVGEEDAFAGLLYAVMREGRKPVQWADGTPNPLPLSEQVRIARVLKIPTQ
jgi:hypothetical protein